MIKRYPVLTALLLAAGCELPQTVPEETPQSATQTSAQTVVNAATAMTAGDAEWDGISWHTGSGPSGRGATQVMTLSASISGGQVNFSWNQWPWGGSMGLVHFFVWNGSAWEGGKFDWIRAGGQSVKSLENVRGGYNGLRAPASGTPVAFAWTDSRGTQRSNLARTTWP